MKESGEKTSGTAKAVLGSGRRLYIACATAADMTELAELHKHSAQFHAPWVYNSADPSGYLEKIASGRTIGILARDKESGILVGVINLNEPVMGQFGSAYLGYYVDQEWAGSGRMTEALGLVLDYAFGAGGFHRLEANIQPGNEPSRALVKRLGFSQEGYSPKYLRINEVWCDHERWAIVADAWLSRAV